jgi:UPF0716 protein FxsA
VKFIFLLLLLPFTELYLFFYLGGVLGWPKVFLWTAVSFFIGKSIIRRQNTLMASATNRGGVVTDPLSQILLMVGGFLLMLPGFITDVLGLMLILPGLRQLILLFFKKHIETMMASGHLKTFSFQGGMPFSKQTTHQNQVVEPENMVIDADYVVKDSGSDGHPLLPE